MFNDPDTKKDVVRFHPKVIQNRSSLDYVNGIAKKAMIALREHYLVVEELYFTAASDKNLSKR